MGLRRWATRHLHSGDLTFLRDLRKGAQETNEGRLERLRKRGFIKLLDSQKVHVTVLGWAALIVKQFMLF